MAGQIQKISEKEPPAEAAPVLSGAASRPSTTTLNDGPGFARTPARVHAAIENDFVSGKFSRGFIKKHYGVEPKT